MPRFPRQLSNSHTYHVMIRGNEKKQIFLDNGDRNRFLDTLGKMKDDVNFHIYAYCLMDNHVHLLIKEGYDNISKIMKRVNVSYAYYFNKKYGRVGHLFQDRFRSEVIEDDTYLLVAARYIHNNPVKAGIVQKPAEYEWSSYNAYINKDDARANLVSKDMLLSMFSDSRISAIKQFKEFTHEYREDERFIDIELDDVKKNPGMNEAELRSKISNVLSKRGTSIDYIKTCKSKKERDALIREIKENINKCSIRQLARVLGVSKDIVFRS